MWQLVSILWFYNREEIKIIIIKIKSLFYLVDCCCVEIMHWEKKTSIGVKRHSNSSLYSAVIHSTSRISWQSIFIRHGKFLYVINCALPSFLISISSLFRKEHCRIPFLALRRQFRHVVKKFSSKKTRWIVDVGRDKITLKFWIKFFKNLPCGLNLYKIKPKCKLTDQVQARKTKEGGEEGKVRPLL